MNITSIAILLSLVTLAAAETRSLRERRLEFAIKRAEYEDLLVKTLDKIIKRGTCKTEFTFEDGQTAVVPFNPCGSNEYCYSNDDDETKYACTENADAPCEDPNACEEDETCEETETYSIAGFTCNPAEPPEVKDTTVSKLERLLKEIEN
ncbi:uncharacterized protein [Ptychodera flava]|uniref:uncharacterized protein isoform X1 n=1 Tax=Ptychodera flava TaxID=63121 RepID=UPI00396A5145